MTREEKLEMFAMLLDGHTLQSIGDKFGISKQRVHQMLDISGARIARAAEDCVYPNIAKWLNHNGYGYLRVAKLCDTSTQTVVGAFKNGKDCRKSFIDKFLAVSGMTYEEAFGEKIEKVEAT